MNTDTHIVYMDDRELDNYIEVCREYYQGIDVERIKQRTEKSPVSFYLDVGDNYERTSIQRCLNMPNKKWKVSVQNIQSHEFKYPLTTDECYRNKQQRLLLL